MDKQIIVTTGYMGSGSSAVTDLLTEFRGLNTCNGDFEYIFMHCPDGLFDLEDKLLMGNNALRSDEAIHSFRKQMLYLYSLKYYWPGMYKEYVSVEFMNIVDKFIDAIVQVKIPDGYWYYSEMPNSLRLHIGQIVYRSLRKLSNGKINIKKPVKYNDLFISIPTEKEFYTAARDFLDEFFSFFEDDALVLDQFLLPHNLYRLDRYFDNAKVVVVDRDPRDVFYSNKYVWMKKGVAVPYVTDVDDFCEQYKRMRECEKIVNNDSILRIRFEDLIYCYDNTVNNIMKHLNLKECDHICKFGKFNPSVSINNTRLFEKFGGPQHEYEIISEKLKEYLYPFEGDISCTEEKNSSKVF